MSLNSWSSNLRQTSSFETAVDSQARCDNEALWNRLHLPKVKASAYRSFPRKVAAIGAVNLSSSRADVMMSHMPSFLPG
eukprot:4461638-Amphidinium_carterae.1